MKMIRTTLAVIALSTLVGFGACTNTGTSTTAGSTPVVLDNAAAQRDIFAAKESYGVAEALATAYAKLDRCASPRVQPCSDQAVLDQITKSRNIARSALNAAEDAVRNPAFGADVTSTAVASAQAAMKAFTSIANQFAPK